MAYYLFKDAAGCRQGRDRLVQELFRFLRAILLAQQVQLFSQLIYVHGRHGSRGRRGHQFQFRKEKYLLPVLFNEVPEVVPGGKPVQDVQELAVDAAFDRTDGLPQGSKVPA